MAERVSARERVDPTDGRTLNKRSSGRSAAWYRVSLQFLAVNCLVAGTVAATVNQLSAQVAQSQPASASVAVWVGRYPQIEAHLKTAAIKRIEDIGTGVTQPQRVYLEPGTPVGSLVWKPLPPGRRRGYWESYKSEIAAYELDKLLAMNMVPPAVERTLKGETGAAVMWVEGTRTVKEMGGNVPSGPSWDKPIRRMTMFDNLIANIDRNAGNILVGRPGELILIDHSRAFITDKKLIRKITRVDAELWTRMTALTRDDLTRTLRPWIDDDQIEAMIERRNKMAAAIDKLVAKNGRALVIIP